VRRRHLRALRLGGGHLAVHLGAGDWLLVGADGYGRIDVRVNFQMDDGALLHLSYFGVLEMTQAIQNAMTTGAGTG
jgi:hypothetical protein